MLLTFLNYLAELFGTPENNNNNKRKRKKEMELQFGGKEGKVRECVSTFSFYRLFLSKEVCLTFDSYR